MVQNQKSTGSETDEDDDDESIRKCRMRPEHQKSMILPNVTEDTHLYGQIWKGITANAH